MFDIGRFKVVWVNYQIMATVAWNVQIAWPEPFRTFEVRSHITWWYSHTQGWSLSTTQCHYLARSAPFRTFERLISILDLSLLRLMPVACIMPCKFQKTPQPDTKRFAHNARRSVFVS